MIGGKRSRLSLDFFLKKNVLLTISFYDVTTVSYQFSFFLLPFRVSVGFMDIVVFLLYHPFLYLKEYAHTISFTVQIWSPDYQSITLP